jgi:hypothetical protein
MWSVVNPVAIGCVRHGALGLDNFLFFVDISCGAVVINFFVLPCWEGSNLLTWRSWSVNRFCARVVLPTSLFILPQQDRGQGYIKLRSDNGYIRIYANRGHGQHNRSNLHRKSTDHRFFVRVFEYTNSQQGNRTRVDQIR